MFKLDELLKATSGKLVNRIGSLDIKGISIDSRTIKPQEAFIAIKGSNFDGHDFIDQVIKKGAGCIIKEVAGKVGTDKAAIIEVKDTVRALGDIARFWRRRFSDIPVIAITGSNGKTTAKEMVAHLFSRRFKVLKNAGTKNNQIGLPLTLLGLDSSYDVVVLEIGTNHFGEVACLAKICQPNVGIITNIGPSHLEYLHNLGGVFREKYSLIENLDSPHIAILNADDDLLRKRAFGRSKKAFVLGFGIKNSCDFFASDIKEARGVFGFGIKQKYRFTLKTLGYYNIYNALAAIAAARLFGISYADIALEMATFDFPQGRLKLRKIGKTRFIDDTYNSNPLSLKGALEALHNFKTKGRKIFVMGDMLELGKSKEEFHCQAGREAARACSIFITVGRLSRLAADAARASGFDKKNIFICDNARQAQDILSRRVLPKKDDLVLAKGSRLMKMEEVFKA
ncbi:MAG: UDP-N-acetylmuramoyl-tripeptide--D-alanyl-D-alanine ligase [Candidatus Omnitrophota bacterium]